MMHRLMPGIAALAVTHLLLAGAVYAREGAALADHPAPRIVNGLATADHPEVGALLFGSRVSSAGLLCSGTLIGCDTFVTAAHCVCQWDGVGCLSPDATRARFFVFLPHAGVFPVASVAVHPDYRPRANGVADLAVLKLTTPVTGIVPARLIDSGTPPLGTPATIVGFGTTGGNGFDAGIKHVGEVVTAACHQPIPDATSVCWDFTNPIGPAGTDSNTCYGDSGGPLFIESGDGDVLAGITTGGMNFQCLTPDHSFDVNVAAYVPWIQTQLGVGVPAGACGTLPQVGAPDAHVLATAGMLTADTPTMTQAFDVPPGTSLLRVAFNATYDFAANIDMFVRAGSAPTRSAFDCRATGRSEFGVCEFHSPTPGTWYAFLSRGATGGAYQLTVTTFGADCSDPANEGAACDDGNPCTANDTCSVGACSGTAAPPLHGCQLPFASGAGSLALLDRPDDTKDKLVWTWTKGTAVSMADFGDPARDTAYALCVYDTAGTPASLLFGKGIPAAGTCDSGRDGKPCWAATAKGFAYKDPKLNNGGISSITLQQGVDGAAAISVRGLGRNLQLPALAPQSPPALTVQLSNSGHCWEGQFQADVLDAGLTFHAVRH